MAENLTYRQHVRAMLKLGLPIAGANLAFVVIGLTDTLMLGWYSVEALAAQVLGWTIYFTAYVVGTGLAYAVMPLVATHSEAGEILEVRRVTRMGIWASMVYALLLFPVMQAGDWLLPLIGQKPQIVPLASDYMAIMGFALFPGLAMMVLRSYLSALERTTILLVANLIAAALNAFVNWVLIFGNLGMPELGLHGAALSSVVTTCAMLLMLAVYARMIAPEHKLFRRLWKIDAGALATVVKLGVPIGATTMAENALFTMTAIMIGWIGPIELAAQGVVIQLTSLAFTLQVAVASAATVRIGRARGRHDATSQRRAASAATGISLSMSFVGILIFVTFPRELVDAFIGPNEAARAQILEVGRILMYLAAAFQTFDGLQAVGLGLLRGIQDTRVPMVMATISYLLIGVPASYVLGFGLGLGAGGIWGGLVIALLVVAGLLIWRFWSKVPQPD